MILSYKFDDVRVEIGLILHQVNTFGHIFDNIQIKRINVMHHLLVDYLRFVFDGRRMNGKTQTFVAFCDGSCDGCIVHQKHMPVVFVVYDWAVILTRIRHQGTNYFRILVIRIHIAFDGFT